jgi:hypothetical protein
MSDPIFKIAKSGQDATSLDQKDLVFDINNNYLVILEERTDRSNASSNLEITHSLGYIPAFYTFFKDVSTGKWYRQLQSGLDGNYADTSKIYIKTDDPNQYVRTVIFGNSQSDAVGSGRNNVSGKLRIAKPGYDAKVDTDLRRFKFASGGGVFKIKEKKKLTVTVNLDGMGMSDDSVSYAHGLGYVPQVSVFLYSATPSAIQIPLFDFLGAGMSVGFDFTVDDTNLTVSVFSAGYSLSDGDEIDFIAHILLDKIE